MTNELLRDRYREAVLAWERAQGQPRQANRLFDQLQQLFKEMRQSEEGRAVITSLVNDAVPVVRLSAASHSLSWRPELAEPVLEELSQEPGLHSVSAAWTLRSHRAGTLDQDW